MATNKKVIKEIQYNSAVRFAIICMGGNRETALNEWCNSQVVSRLRLTYKSLQFSLQIVLYFFDNFLFVAIGR